MTLLGADELGFDTLEPRCVPQTMMCQGNLKHERKELFEHPTLDLEPISCSSQLRKFTRVHLSTNQM